MSAPQRISLVYAGMIRHEGQLLHTYFPISRRTGQLEPEPSLYAAPLGSFDVGSVLSCQTPDDGASILPTGIKQSGVWEDVELVQQWRTQHETIASSEAAWTRPIPEDSFACAKPLREAFHRLDPEGRILLVAQLVRWISQEV